MPICKNCGAYYVRPPCPACLTGAPLSEKREHPRVSKITNWFRRRPETVDEDIQLETETMKNMLDIDEQASPQETQLQIYTQRIIQLEKDAETKEIKLLEHERSIKNLKDEIMEKERKLADLKGELKQKIQLIESLESQLSEKDQYSALIENQKIEAQNRVNDLEEEKRTLEIENQVKIQTIEQLKEQLAPSLPKEEPSESMNQRLNIDEELLKTFLQEFEELHGLAQNALEAFFQGDHSHIFDLYRAFHTWKGSASLMGFHQLFQLSSAYSDFLRPLKQLNPANLTSNQLDLIKECLITLKEFHKVISEGSTGENIPVVSLIEAIKLESQEIII